MDRWPNQIRAMQAWHRLIENQVERACLTSPTGSGKSQILLDMLEDCVARRWKAVVYTPRRLLVQQLIDDFEANKVRFGVRAASHKNRLALLENIQISTFTSERSQCYQKKKRELHKADAVFVDECHFGGSIAEQILDDHVEAKIKLGLTATPIGIKHMYDHLEVVGTNSELRKIGALVPAYTYAIDEPDLDKVKANKDGEYVWKGKRKLRWLHRIVGRVLANWRILNPDEKPTILFAPGLKESIWFCKQFERMGVRAAHIDGDDVYVDGKSRRVKQEERKDILDEVRSGDIKVLCNRFVLREGVNIRELAHCILATPIGSLAAYVQCVGRVLRACEGLEHVTIQDHGGLWWRLGSANMDRDWHEMWEIPPKMAGHVLMEKMTDAPERQPRCCFKCGAVSGRKYEKCHNCGFQLEMTGRRVVQEDGTLREVHGDPIVKPTYIRRHDTEKLWKQCYWACKNSGKTFRQAIGLFKYRHHYTPPPDLPLMPKHPAHRMRPISEVPMEGLHGWEGGAKGDTPPTLFEKPPF